MFASKPFVNLRLKLMTNKIKKYIRKKELNGIEVKKG